MEVSKGTRLHSDALPDAGSLVSPFSLAILSPLSAFRSHHSGASTLAALTKWRKRQNTQILNGYCEWLPYCEWFTTSGYYEWLPYYKWLLRMVTWLNGD